jgi:hypothetical protein
MRGKLAGTFAVAALLSSGCATRKYVHNEVSPLSDRLAKLESEMASMGKAGSQGNDLDALKEQAETGAHQAQVASASANEAASRAENAATKAEQASNKAAKAFEMQQRK